MANDYAINYDDKRFQEVEADKKAAISDVEKTYSGMANESDAYYQAQIDAAKDWEKKQTQLQNEQTEFAISEIEQQKAQEKKDYLKEQSGAYQDWQKQSNEYGADAEAMAAQGMQDTGYSESSKVSMFNTYQQRYVAARESYNLAVQNYNNAITEARLQNNSALAQIAKDSLQKQLELSLQGFQYKNQLLLEQANKKLEVDQMYHDRWQDVLNQMNTENALAEQIRQHNESLAEEKRQYNETLALQKEQLAEEKRQFDQRYGSSGGSGGGSGGGSSKSSSSSGASIKKTSSGSSKSSGASINKSGSSSSGSSPTLNLQSVLDAGLGPASASTIAKAVKKGDVSLSVDKKTNTASVKKNTPSLSAALNPSTWLANKVNKNKK